MELRGDLGAGKTTFTRHLLQALGVKGRIKSPSYAVVESHQTADLSIWHFDFYRFNDPREWADAGLRDLFASPGLKLAEWPQQAQGMLPTPDWVLQIDVPVDQPRQVSINALTEKGQTLLDSVLTP
jgi:tRNA threonylcarbamoyladenosine biosynthesis protein TsaE